MKTKWIKFECELELRDIMDSLLTSPILTNSDYGFDINEIEDDLLEGTYYEKSVEIQEYNLPNGSVINSETFKVTLFDFIVYTTSANYLICIKSPPRSLKGFIEKLAILLTSPVYFSNLCIDIIKLIDVLASRKTVSQLKIKDLSVSNLFIDNNNIADLKIRSTTNALNALKSNFSNQNLNVKAATINLKFEDMTQIIKITKTVLIDCTEEISEQLRSIIEETGYSTTG